MTEQPAAENTHPQPDSTPPPEERPPVRTMWFVILGGFTVIMFLILLLMQSLGQSSAAAVATPTPPTIGELVEVSLPEVGITLLSPKAWAKPAIIDQQRLVLSEDGSGDTRTTAKPFLFIVVDAMPLFQQQLTFRADYDDPVTQLDALIAAINRDRARFDPAEIYTGSPYPAAITRGVERGNELTIVLLRGPDNRWIYVGAQAPVSQFRYYERDVFLPSTNAIRLMPR